jgi:hypothetical protein
MAVLAVCALSVPSVRTALWDAVPDFDDGNDCRAVACGPDGAARSGDAPEMRFKQR